MDDLNGIYSRTQHEQFDIPFNPIPTSNHHLLTHTPCIILLFARSHSTPTSSNIITLNICISMNIKQWIKKVEFHENYRTLNSDGEIPTEFETIFLFRGAVIFTDFRNCVIRYYWKRQHNDNDKMQKKWKWNLIWCYGKEREEDYWMSCFNYTWYIRLTLIDCFVWCWRVFRVVSGPVNGIQWKLEGTKKQKKLTWMSAMGALGYYSDDVIRSPSTHTNTH